MRYPIVPKSNAFYVGWAAVLFPQWVVDSFLQAADYVQQVATALQNGSVKDEGTEKLKTFEILY